MKKKIFYCIMIFLLIEITLSGKERIKTDSPMVLIPAGEFMMGKDSKEGADFSPAHKVRVNAFYMDIHEVTN